MSYPTYVQEVNAITNVINQYIEGARTGKSAAMKPAFHEGATIYGYVGPDMFGGPIQGLFDWNDANGPAKDIQSNITSVDVVGVLNFSDFKNPSLRPFAPRHLTDLARRPHCDCPAAPHSVGTNRRALNRAQVFRKNSSKRHTWGLSLD